MTTTLRIRGGAPDLRGTIAVSGSKNASVALICAALLAKGVSQLHNVPAIDDVRQLQKFLSTTAGVQFHRHGSDLTIDTTRLHAPTAPSSADSTAAAGRSASRSTILALGPLLARFGHVTLPLPGGCNIGPRPIDQHIKALTALGAGIQAGAHSSRIVASGILRAPHAAIHFDMPTVTATINTLLAAVLVLGTTRLTNAAREPEVVELAACLRSMGATIDGAGTPTITVRGWSELRPFEHTVSADRIEAGTLLIAGALFGTPLRIAGDEAMASKLTAVIEVLRKTGAHIQASPNGYLLTVFRPARLRAVPHVIAAPYPAFPTDLLPQLLTLLSVADGTSVVTDGVFPTRFGTVAALRAFGANIALDVTRGRATVRGVEKLVEVEVEVEGEGGGGVDTVGTVRALDIRGGAALLLAGLLAEGETVLEGAEAVGRGYEALGTKLAAVGARIGSEDGNRISRL